MLPLICLVSLVVPHLSSGRSAASLKGGSGGWARGGFGIACIGKGAIALKVSKEFQIIIVVPIQRAENACLQFFLIALRRFSHRRRRLHTRDNIVERCDSVLS